VEQLALRVAAVAGDAARLVAKLCAAVRAGPHREAANLVHVYLDRFGLLLIFLGNDRCACPGGCAFHVLDKGLGERVRAGVNLVRAEAVRRLAGYAHQLLRNRLDREPAPQREGHHAPHALALARGAPAGLPDLREDLERAAFLVLVYRDVERAAPGLQLVGPAVEFVGPLARAFM